MSWMSSHYVKKALRFLKKADITISGMWIDCGCGYGTYSEALAILGADPVIAIDYRMSKLPRMDSVFPVAADCCHLPVKGGSVSGFLLVNVLHYYKRPHLLVQEAYRVLKKGGHLLVIEYSQCSPTAWDPYPLTAGDIEILLQRFDIPRIMLVDTGYRPKHLVVGKK